MQNDRLKIGVLSLAFGFVIWLCGTLVFQLYGQYFFIPTQWKNMIILYLGAVPLFGGATILYLNYFKLPKLTGIYATVLLVVPMLILDSFCVRFFSIVFPNLPTQFDGAFAAWLMWVYAAVLFSSIVRKGYEN